MDTTAIYVRDIGLVEVSTDLLYNLLRLLLALTPLLALYLTFRKGCSVKLTFLLDSRGGDGKLLSAWGLSILINICGKYILFDVGPNWSLITNNANVLKSPINEVDYIVISHWHNDHAGGLGGALRYYDKLGRDVKIYVPEERAVPPDTNVVICKEPVKLLNDVLTTGALGYFIKEQALIIKLSSKKPLIIVGCSHPGIDVILSHVVKLTGSKSVYGIIGGYHIGESEAHALLELLKTYRVKVIAPAHCTSDKAIEVLKQRFKGKFIDVHTGSVVEL